MRASRLLSIVLLLQNRGRMTAPELARELEVSVRTVYRDVESLSAAGVPVYADRGPAGGYQLLDGYRTRLTGLSGDEAESLFLSGMPAPAAAELGLGSVMATAQLKVMAALPEELRTRAVRVQERFHLDAPTWFREVERSEHLTAVADAVWNQRVVEVRYERWGRKQVTRVLEPYGLVLKTGVWYLAAQPRSAQVAESAPSSALSSAPSSALSSAPSLGPPPEAAPAPAPSPAAAPSPAPAPAPAGMRTYRVSRIKALAVLDEQFDRVPDFDLPAHWERWSEQYRERIYRAEAVVRLSPLAQDLIGYYMGAAAARAVRETGSAPDADGWVRAVVPVGSLTQARMELFRFGPDVEVLEPTELRALMAESADAVRTLYQTDA